MDTYNGTYNQPYQDYNNNNDHNNNSPYTTSQQPLVYPPASPSHSAASSSSPSPASSAPSILQGGGEYNRLGMGTSHFKSYYCLKQSPFDVVRAEATDPSIRERCLIPNLQVAPLSFDQKPTSMLFFGPRGSGKTTIRMELLESVSREKFLPIDCFKHATINDCLTNFRDNTQPDHGLQKGVGMHWVEHFKEHWTSDHFVSVLMACALKKIVRFCLDEANENAVQKLTREERIRLMFLAHRYALCSPQRLANIADQFLGPPDKPGTIANVAKYGSLAVVGTCAVSATSYGVMNMVPAKEMRQSLAAVGGAAFLLGMGVLSYWNTSGDSSGIEKKAKDLLCPVVCHSHDRILAMSLFLENYMEDSGSVEEILANYNRPLKDLQKTVKRLGYVAPMLVCDGLDEAELLDPSKYPGVLNHLVQEMCHFHILTSAFLVLFLPNTVSKLGLNDPFIIKRWRRDIFPPRELQWEADTLLQLASRRFAAYQTKREAEEGGEGGEGGRVPTFEDLLSKVSLGGRVRYLSRLRTPRQMLLCCAALILRLEREGRIFATDSDLELTVSLALNNADVDS